MESTDWFVPLTALWNDKLQKIYNKQNSFENYAPLKLVYKKEKLQVEN